MGRGLERVGRGRLGKERLKAPDLCLECGASWSCEHSARKPVKAPPDEADKIAAAFKEAPRPVYWTWCDRADFVLSRLFNEGHFMPSPKEIFDAYPFGMREYFPYKVWLRQVKWWKTLTETGRIPQPKARKPEPVSPLQGSLL